MAWETPRRAHHDASRAEWLVAGNLDGNLARALRDDSSAQRVAGVPTREVIDFDPFLYSQDPCPRYEALHARREKGLYLVPVRPVCTDTTWQTDRPVVAISRASGQWRIVNVFYEKSDLMGLLCQFAKADKRPQPLPPG